MTNLLSVKQFSERIGSSERSTYVRLSKKRFIEELYCHIGSRVFFFESRLNECLLNGKDILKPLMKGEK